MGTSTDAIMFYGLIWGTEGPVWKPDEHTSEDWRAILERKLGALESMTYTERDNLRKSLGVTIVQHCYADGAEMYGVGIIPSIVVANRGAPQPIQMRDLRLVPPLWNSQILHFCDVMGIDPHTSESTMDAHALHLGWWLCSNWSP